MDLSGLSELVDLLRAKGVRRFKCDAVEIELDAGPKPSVPPPLPAADVVPLANVFPEDACNCGHSIPVEHGEFGCFFGCSLAICNNDDPVQKLLNADS